MQTIYDLIESGKYYNAHPWVSQEDKKGWKDNQKAIEQQFYHDLCHWCGLDPEESRSKKIWDWSWNRGNAETYNDRNYVNVAQEFDYAVSFIRDLKNE